MQWSELSSHLYTSHWLSKVGILLFSHHGVTALIITLLLMLLLIFVALIEVRDISAAVVTEEPEGISKFVSVAIVKIKKPSVRMSALLSFLSYILFWIVPAAPPLGNFKKFLSQLGVQSVWELSPVGVSYLLKVVAVFGTLDLVLLIISLLWPMATTLVEKCSIGSGKDDKSDKQQGSSRAERIISLITWSLTIIAAAFFAVLLVFLAKEEVSPKQSPSVREEVGSLSTQWLYDKKQKAQVVRIVFRAIHHDKLDANHVKLKVPILNKYDRYFDLIRQRTINIPFHVFFILNIDSTSAKDDSFNARAAEYTSIFWEDVYDELTGIFNFNGGNVNSGSDIARVYLVGGSKCINAKPLPKGEYLCTCTHKNEVFNALMHATECAYSDLNRSHLSVYKISDVLNQIIEQDKGASQAIIIVLNWSDDIVSLDDMFPFPLGKENVPLVLIQRDRYFENEGNGQIQVIKLDDPRVTMHLRNPEEVIRKEFTVLRRTVNEQRNYKEEIFDFRNKGLLLDESAIARYDKNALNIPKGGLRGHISLPLVWKIWLVLSVINIMSELLLLLVLLCCTDCSDFKEWILPKVAELERETSSKV